MITNRTTLLGRKAEKEQLAFNLKIEIDTAVKGMILQFDPMDQDLQYVENILPERLKVNVCTIDRKVKILRTVLAELKSINEQLG
jgi:hypothetical protein